MTPSRVGPLCWLGVLGFATDMSSLQESSIWESVCVWWGRLERQSGTRLRYLFTITLAPTGLVHGCPVKVLFSSRSTGIAPPPLLNFSWGPENLSLLYVLCTWAAIRRNLSLFYLLVVACFKLASVFGAGWPTVCVIDAELAPFYGAPMVG